MRTKHLLLFLAAFALVFFVTFSAQAKIIGLTGYNNSGNNGGIVPLIAESSGTPSSVTFQYYDEDASEWVELFVDTDGSDGWKYLWDTGTLSVPGASIRVEDSINPGTYFNASIRVQNVIADMITGLRNPSSGIVKFSASYTITGETLTWPEQFPINETCDQYSYGYSYTSFGTKGATQVSGNIIQIRSNFTDYTSNSGTGSLKWKILTGSSYTAMTMIGTTGNLTIGHGIQTYAVNFLNVPAGANVAMYYGSTYSTYCRRYDSSFSSSMYSTYGYVVYASGDIGTGYYYSYNYYTGAPIEYTISTYPPDVTQMEAGYSVDGGSSWTTIGNGVASATKVDTYDFTWNTQDLVAPNVIVGVRAFAGDWCSWYQSTPITVENKLFVSVTNNLGFGTVDIDGTNFNVPFTGNWLYRTDYEVSAQPSIVKTGEVGRRYSFDNWSDGGEIVHDVNMTYGMNPLIQANYVQQVTMKVQSPFYGSIEYDGWLAANTYYNYEVESPQQIDANTRYVCSGWTGTGSIGDGEGPSTGDFFLKDPSTITFNWYAEYMLRVYNDHGENSGSPAGWYAAGSNLRCASTEFVQLPASTRYHCIGWFSSGSLENGDGIDTGDFILDEPTSVSWIFIFEVGLTIRTNHGTTDPEGTNWIRKGNLLTIEATKPPDTATEKYTWQGWTTPESTVKSGDPVLVYRADIAGSINAWWLAEYNISVTTNGSFDQDYSGWYNEGASVPITSIPPVASEGERYLLSWEADGIGMSGIDASPATPNPYSFTILSPAHIQATWVRQVAFTVVDPQSAGVNLYPAIGSYWKNIGDTVQGRADYSYQGIICSGYTGTGSIASDITPYFSFIIMEPSSVSWNFELRDVSNQPSPVWNDPFTLATNAFGTGCSIARMGDQSPVVAYTGSPVSDGKADQAMKPDSIKVGWLKDGEWVVDVIDSFGTFGERVSIAVDSNDNPYVVYIKDSEPTVARFINDAWVIEALSPVYGATNYIDIAIDEDDAPHIAYYSSTIGGLIYVTLSENAWEAEIVDNDGNVGLYCSIAVMPVLKWVSISYYDSTNRNVKFARKEMGSWVLSVIDNNGDVGRNGNLALDPSGAPYICYQVQSEPAEMGLRIAWLIPDGWEVIDLSANNISGYDISMEIDDFGIIHVSYRDYDSLRYAWYNGVTWGVNYDIAGTEANGMTDISLDNAGQPSIVFWDGSDLKFVDTVDSQYDGPLGTDVTNLNNGSGGGGCFVATAAFGAYQVSDVLMLTNFRDSVLNNCRTGSSIVNLYYSVSPVAADQLRESNAFRALVRRFLP